MPCPGKTMRTRREPWARIMIQSTTGEVYFSDGPHFSPHEPLPPDRFPEVPARPFDSTRSCCPPSSDCWPAG